MIIMQGWIKTRQASGITFCHRELTEEQSNYLAGISTSNYVNVGSVFEAFKWLLAVLNFLNWTIVDELSVGISARLYLFDV